MTVPSPSHNCSFVWAVESKTISALFATEDLAQKYVSSLPASVSGGMSMARLAVIGDSMLSETPRITPELREVLDYYDQIAARAPVDDTEWDFVMTAAEYRKIREALDE